MNHRFLHAPWLVVIGLLANTAHADTPRPPSVTCNGGGLSAPPTFGRAPPGVAEYRFSAWCVTRTGQHLGYQATATWTPSEANPANANASEAYRITSLSGPSRRFDVILGGRCDRDPWLNPQARCSRVGDNLPDELRALWPELARDLFPYSRHAIPYGEQDTLRARYGRMNGSATAAIGPPAGAFVEPRAPGGAASVLGRTQPANTVRIQVRYPVQYGYRDAAGLFDASPNSCGAFRIEAVPATVDPGRPLVGIHTEPRMATVDGMYVCDYLASELPLNEPISVRVTMSDQAAAASQPWQGASRQPANGERRTIRDGSRQVTLNPQRPRALEVFDMAYSAGADLPAAIRPVARVKGPGSAPAAPRPICDAARDARDRNSPAAPGLEARCRAEQLQAMQAPATDLDALAAKGPSIASQDPLAQSLRNQQTNSAALRGFDIGMAAAEGQTGPGPGKQRIHDALPPAQQAGFSTAVAFSLERNRYADRAAKGAAIALADPVVATARDAETDAFYRLGFDIATAIFGDPALGAQGNTATGPGSLGIRDSLSAAGQRGFNDAVTLHLARGYGR